MICLFLHLTMNRHRLCSKIHPGNISYLLRFLSGFLLGHRTIHPSIVKIIRLNLQRVHRSKPHPHEKRQNGSIRTRTLPELHDRLDHCATHVDPCEILLGVRLCPMLPGFLLKKHVLYWSWYSMWEQFNEKYACVHTVGCLFYMGQKLCQHQ